MPLLWGLLFLSLLSCSSMKFWWKGTNGAISHTLCPLWVPLSFNHKHIFTHWNLHHRSRPQGSADSHKLNKNLSANVYPFIYRWLAHWLYFSHNEWSHHYKDRACAPDAVGLIAKTEISHDHAEDSVHRPVCLRGVLITSQEHFFHFGMSLYCDDVARAGSSTAKLQCPMPRLFSTPAETTPSPPLDEDNISSVSAASASYASAAPTSVWWIPAHDDRSSGLRLGPAPIVSLQAIELLPRGVLQSIKPSIGGLRVTRPPWHLAVC